MVETQAQKWSQADLLGPATVVTNQILRKQSTVSSTEGFRSLSKSLGRNETGLHPGTSGLNKQLRVISKHLVLDKD